MRAVQGIRIGLSPQLIALAEQYSMQHARQRLVFRHPARHFNTHQRRSLFTPHVQIKEMDRDLVGEALCRA